MLRSKPALVTNGRPFLAEFIRTAYNPFGQFAEACRPVAAIRSCARRRNVERLQLVEDGLHRPVRFAEEDTAPYAGEGPSESLEHGLSLHVVAELFRREIAIPIALNGQALTITFHDQIDVARTDHPPWNDVVASLDQTLYDIALECGLDPSSFVGEAPGKELGGLGVLNESPPQVARVKVHLRI